MKIIYSILSIVFIFSSLWCLMWIFSSFSLASEYCKNSFSLFNTVFRCKQPLIAFILFILFGLLGFFTLFNIIKK
jgi:hypothetical protein